jgi:hypothetical protein
MDATLSGVLVAKLTSFGDSAIDLMGQILPVAIPVVITFALLYKAISFFRGIAHV